MSFFKYKLSNNSLLSFIYKSIHTTDSLFTKLILTCASLVPKATSYQWSVVAFLTLNGFPLSISISLIWVGLIFIEKNKPLGISISAASAVVALFSFFLIGRFTR